MSSLHIQERSREKELEKGREWKIENGLVAEQPILYALSSYLNLLILTSGTNS